MNGCSHGYRGDLCNESLYFLRDFVALLIINLPKKIISLQVYDLVFLLSYHYRISDKYLSLYISFTNLRCVTACPSGFFGLDCINRCDTYCTGDKSCDPVMGICNEGCKKGWSGLMCDLGISTKPARY